VYHYYGGLQVPTFVQRLGMVYLAFGRKLALVGHHTLGVLLL